MDKKNALPFEIKSFPIEVKIDEEGIVEAVPAVFEIQDDNGDIIHRGSFSKTLRENKGIVPILAQHFGEQIGWNLSAKEKDEGLFVRGQLDLQVQTAREKFSLVRSALALGIKVGLSIGYKTIKADFIANVRHIRELKWFEWSFEIFPANPMARILTVKSGFLMDALPQGAAHDDIDPEILQSVKRLTQIIRGR